MEKEIKIQIPEGLINPSHDEQAEKSTLLLNEKNFEQVKTVLASGRRKALQYLERTKESYKRISRGVDINNIDSCIYKAKHCKPKTFYPLELHKSEVEVLLDLFERSGKRKSKEMQQFIDMLYEALE